MEVSPPSDRSIVCDEDNYFPELVRYQDRFRDRALTLGSVEYQYDLGLRFASYLFVDAGRVWRSLSDFELDGLRIGYGGGVQVHTADAFLLRFNIASSIDGGLFFNLGFDPAFDVRDRTGRY